MKVICGEWLNISMYEPERIVNGGLVREPEPPRTLPEPPPAELYNIVDDPLEEANLADRHPDVAHRLLIELETWFDEVERERATIDDVW